MQNSKLKIKTMKSMKIRKPNLLLFAALERLGDEGMSAEQVASEVERAKAVSGVVGQYVALAKAEIAEGEAD
jgi:hypothetical protein